MINIDNRNKFIGSGFYLYEANKRLNLQNAIKVISSHDTILQFLSEQYNNDTELLLMRIINYLNYLHNYMSIKEVISLDLKYYNYKGRKIPIKKCEEVKRGFILFMDKNDRIIAYIKDIRKEF